MSLVHPTTAQEHAARRYFRAETRFRRLMWQADVEGKDAEREGARKYADWCHRAAVVEVRDPEPGEPA